MQVSNNLVFDSYTATANASAWVNVGLLNPGSSLHILGLESGGKINVFLSNTPSAPTDNSTGVQVGTFTGIVGGAAQFVAGPTLPGQWLQIVKIPGAGPTETTVRLLGQIG